jgi:hypothetical protein
VAGYGGRHPGGVRVVSDGDGTRLLTLRMGTGTVSLASELNYDFYLQPEYDTIDATLWYFQAIRDVVDGPGRHEAALRPSQILAVSLPHSPLVPHSSARWSTPAAVRCCVVRPALSGIVGASIPGNLRR